MKQSDWKRDGVKIASCYRTIVNGKDLDSFIRAVPESEWVHIVKELTHFCAEKQRGTKGRWKDYRLFL